MSELSTTKCSRCGKIIKYGSKVKTIVGALIDGGNQVDPIHYYRISCFFAKSKTKDKER